MDPKHSRNLLVWMIVFGCLEAVLVFFLGLAALLAPAYAEYLPRLFQQGTLPYDLDYVTGGLVGIGLAGVVLGIVTFWACLACLSYHNVARWSTVVLGVLSLLNFPVGTVFGVLAVWALLIDRNNVDLFRHRTQGGATARRPAYRGAV